MWHMQLCKNDTDPLVEEDFETPEDWREWLREHHPRLLHSKAFSTDRESFKQQGTGYYWSSLYRRS